jgi:hypothetical protein
VILRDARKGKRERDSDDKSVMERKCGELARGYRAAKLVEGIESGN